MRRDGGSCDGRRHEVQVSLKRLGQEAVDMLSQDGDWGDLLDAFSRDFFD